jgi:hypothetical protein
MVTTEIQVLCVSRYRLSKVMVKVKNVKLSLCLNKHTMKAYWGVEV